MGMSDEKNMCARFRYLGMDREDWIRSTKEIKEIYNNTRKQMREEQRREKLIREIGKIVRE